MAGSTVTAITSSAHGLINSEYVNITGAKTPNPITSLAQTSGIGRLVTQFNHDVTRNTPLRTGDSSTITISGANEAAYNGTFTIYSVTNSNVIEFVIDDAAPAAATGSPQLDEDISIFFNGYQQVTVIDTTTFTYEITNSPTTNTASGTIELDKGYRISGDRTIEHAIKAYTPQLSLGHWWAFVVVDSAQVNKQRGSGSDSQSSYRKGQDLRQILIQNISVYLVAKNTTDVTSIDVIDDIEELRPFILKSLHLAEFDTGFDDDTTNIVYVGDGQAEDTTDAYYVHQFAFQAEYWTSNVDGVDPAYTKAFREFDLRTLNNNNETITQDTGELPNEKV